MDPDSSELLRRVGDGDESALARLYELYSAAVFGFVVRRVPDYGHAEEVCGDVWLGCWRSAKAFRGDSRVLTWLLGIAKRQVYTHFRVQRPTALPLDEHLDMVSPDSDDPSRIVAESQGFAALTDAIQALPEELYEVVSLAWLHDLSYPEIAGAVQIPVGTVKSRVSRARTILRKRIGEAHD